MSTAVGNTAKLAIHGGQPVRTAPFPSERPGAAVFGSEEEAAVVEVIRAHSPFRHYGAGKVGRTRQFEIELARHVGTRYALAVSSGTAALKVGLAALGVGPGDEVIVPAFTWIACPAAVALCGAVPVLAEIDETLTLDPKDLDHKITPRTKAIMVVHTAGAAADMDAILDVARHRGLRVIEDCAQSAGARFHGRPVGSLGDVGAFSLQMNKLLTSGEGGALTTDDPVLFERAVAYHDLGFIRPQFDIQQPSLTPGFGENYRMSELTGALALAQLRKLETNILAPLRRHKGRLREALDGEPGLSPRALPDASGDTGATFTFLAPDPEQAGRMAEALAAENVPFSRPYGGKVLYEAWPEIFAGENGPARRGTQHLTPQFPFGRYRRGCCPRSEAILGRALTLSLTPILTERDVDNAIAAVRKVRCALIP